MSCVSQSNEKASNYNPLKIFEMAYSEFLADRIRHRLTRCQGIVIEKKMIGGLVFMINNKMCVSINTDKKNGIDRLMVRVNKLHYKDLLKKEGSRKMDFTGKEMKGFLFIDPDGYDSEVDLDFWIDRALEFNEMIK